MQEQPGKTRGFESWKVELTAGDCIHPTVISSSQTSLPDSFLIHHENEWTSAQLRIPSDANINSFQQILHLSGRAQHFLPNAKELLTSPPKHYLFSHSYFTNGIRQLPCSDKPRIKRLNCTSDRMCAVS